MEIGSCTKLFSMDEISCEGNLKGAQRMGNWQLWSITHMALFALVGVNVELSILSCHFING